MIVARREFLEFDDGLFDPKAPSASQGQDYGLIIGVNDYPKLRSLHGAIADAKAFKEWLIHGRGGGLPPANVRTILSTSDPLSPVGNEINDTLEELLERANTTGGRRFYFYFSGHGCMGDRASDIALCLANWSELRRRAALSSDAWLDVIVRSGAFDEVAFFLDCCRVWAARAVGLPPSIDFARPVEREQATRVFVAYATEIQRPALETSSSDSAEMRGIFTKVLIEGLCGEAADDYNEGVTAESLKRHLETSVKPQANRLGLRQRAEVLNGFDPMATFGLAEGSGMVVTFCSDPDYDYDTRILANFKPWFYAFIETLKQRLLASDTIDPIPVSTTIDTPVGDSACRIFVVLRDQWLSGVDWSIHAEGVDIDFHRKMTWISGPNGSVFSARLAPGTYTLRWAGQRDLVICLFPGFDTQMGIELNGQHPQFDSPRMFLVPAAQNPYELPTVPIAEAIEAGIALLGAVSFDLSVEEIPRSILDVMAGGPFDDPMLGLIAAYLLSRKKSPDPVRIAAIANHIESMIGPCPDVHALRLRVTLLRGMDLPAERCTEPPIFRDGLVAFVEASHHIPEIIVSGSLLEQACVHRIVDSPISSWPSQTGAETSENDWLIVAVADVVVEHINRGKSIDARTIATELGVPTLAVQARLRSNNQEGVSSAEPAIRI